LEVKPTEPEDVNSQVAEILARLPEDPRVWAELGRRFRVELFCGWFLNDSNQGVAISAANLRALGERGIELQLDIYGPETDA